MQALLQTADFLAHVAAQSRIEIAQRFDEQQHTGIQHQRTRQRDPLLLAARELAGQALVVADQADDAQRLYGAPAASPFSMPDS